MEDELQGATADAGGIDMAAAVDEIGAGLGLEPPEATEGEGEGTPSPEGTPAAPPAQGQAAVKPPGLSPDNPAGVPKAPSPDTPPSTWREGPKAKWATLDPEVRAEIIKREDDFFKGIEGYKADAHVGKQLNQVLQPYMETLQKYDIEPMQEINNLLAAHHQLALGTPAIKLQAFKGLMKEYGIPADQLLDQPAGEQPYRDPAVETLQQRLDSLESRQAQERAAQLRQEITAFSADPANPYFAELANDIAALYRTGLVKTLREAYDKALWLNPVVRQKELDRQQAEKDKQAETDRLNRLNAAKKAAAAKMKSSTPGRADTGTAGSMDDTLNATLRGIRERST